MAIVNDVTGSNSAGTGKTNTSTQRLDQEQFFNIMLAQLKNQDPTNPLESAEFFSQLAQLSTVSGIQDLQTAFTQLSDSLQSNQALQAASVVGHDVLVPSDFGVLPTGGSLSGAFALTSDVSDARVKVYDQSGQLVRTLDLGAQRSGTVHFSWDGLNNDGQASAPGIYRVQIETVSDGKVSAVGASVWNRVDSVTLGTMGQELTLNLAGLGSIPFSQAQQIR